MKLTLGFLDSSSPYKVGLDYERLTLAVLRGYSFHLKRTGGPRDGGQDFTGHWSLPERNIPVIGQCKRYKKMVGPSDVREFEDVLYRKFVQQDRHGLYSRHHVTGLCRGSSTTETLSKASNHLGVMVSRSWFSALALKTFHSSQMAMILLQVLEADTEPDHPRRDLEPNTSTQGPESHSTHHDNATLEPNSRFQASEEDACLSEDSTDPTDDDVGWKGEEREEGEMMGYVNEVALNVKALQGVGGVQLSWKWSTGRHTHHTHRELVLTYNNQPITHT